MVPLAGTRSYVEWADRTTVAVPTASAPSGSPLSPTCWRRLQILLGHMLCSHNPAVAEGGRMDAFRGFRGFSDFSGFSERRQITNR